MPRLTIDNQTVEVPEGTSVLQAAQQLGIEIPHMCFMQGVEPATSCMLCVVQVEGRSDLVPSCALQATDGMVIHTDSDQIREARKTALELLLSDHLGDCMGPCQIVCPAQMNIPLMIRQILAGQLGDAITTVKKDIALPAVLGRICPAPCEKGCRRKQHDQPVAICLLKRFVADEDLKAGQPYRPHCKSPIGKNVAIVGAGPAGLAATYYLSQEGIACTVFDDHEAPGGMLRYGVPREQLPLDILEKEIRQITDLGIDIQCNTRVGRDVSFDEIRSQFDAVFVATGTSDDAGLPEMEKTSRGLAIDSRTYKTSIAGVFAGGDVVRKRKLTVRAVADGKEAAAAIAQYVKSEPVSGIDPPFNSRMGKLEPNELALLASLVSGGRQVKTSPPQAGFSIEEAIAEAGRCLHCNCRKPDDCKLRQYSQIFHASRSRYKGSRRTLQINTQHADVIFEPCKCIRCGLCVQITAIQKEPLGLSFIGRGFNVEVAAPLDDSIRAALQKTAETCIQACPTGALAARTA